MRRTRRRKHSWLGRLIVKFFVVVSVLAGALFGISACARKDIGELSGNQPRLVLEEFFTGKSIAYGIFEDRFGNLRRQFRVNLNGNLDGNRLVLDEEFLYDDGERASRTWTIDRLGTGTNGIVMYQGRRLKCPVWVSMCISTIGSTNRMKTSRSTAPMFPNSVSRLVR